MVQEFKLKTAVNLPPKGSKKTKAWRGHTLTKRFPRQTNQNHLLFFIRLPPFVCPTRFPPEIQEFSR